jgi:hypothetical protein
MPKENVVRIFTLWQKVSYLSHERVDASVNGAMLCGDIM